jgi:hypothetical protein
MKKINGKLYFESTDVIYIIDLLLGTLGDNNFVSIQTSADRIIIEKAIKNYKQEILFTLVTENAVKFDFIETIYTQLMHPATNILSPDIYNQLPYHDISSTDMRKCENWFYNYGLSLAIAEFEKK